MHITQQIDLSINDYIKLFNFYGHSSFLYKLTMIDVKGLRIGGIGVENKQKKLTFKTLCYC